MRRADGEYGKTVGMTSIEELAVDGWGKPDLYGCAYKTVTFLNSDFHKLPKDGKDVFMLFDVNFKKLPKILKSTELVTWDYFEVDWKNGRYRTS